MTADENILDDLFHGCALDAFLEQSRIQQCWPDPEATRRRAYRLYYTFLVILSHLDDFLGRSLMRVRSRCRAVWK